MAGNKQAGITLRNTMIARYGSVEAWRDHMRTIGAKGGSLGHTGGFAANYELARIAGAKGGRISRRRKQR
jgi:general stress protein YciG